MYQADIYATKTFLKELLERSTTTQGQEWLTKKMELIDAEGATPKDLYLAFSAAPRFVGREPLHLSQHEIEMANLIRPGFNPSRWNAAQTARTLLILSQPYQDGEAFRDTIETLFNTADMGELVALYAALPLLPHPELFRSRAEIGRAHV